MVSSINDVSCFCNALLTCCWNMQQLPLSLLKTAQGHPMLIELKNGDTYNGRLVSCNMFMNINLREVICTSKVSTAATEILSVLGYTDLF